MLCKFVIEVRRNPIHQTHSSGGFRGARGAIAPLLATSRNTEESTGDGKQESIVLRYSSPKFTLEVKAVRKGHIPVKTHEQDAWAGVIWSDWAKY